VVEEQFAMEITTIPGQWKQGMDDKQQWDSLQQASQAARAF
jgi:hypothetical protein